MIKKPKNITKDPGIYLFKNTLQEVIYIGKAKNIAKRVASYFTKQPTQKIELLLSESVKVDTIPTSSEEEALHLEARLIKKYQPKFNILLKDGNPFSFIFFSEEKIPKMYLVRTKEKKGTYLGPFLQAKQARTVYNFLLNTFQLKICNQKIEHGCLEYHIGICSGSCRQNFNLDFYIFRLTLAQQILQKKSKETLKLLNDKIKEFSLALKFEQAQKISKYKEDLESIIQTVERLSSMPSKQTAKNSKHNLPLLIKIKQKLKLKHVPYVIDCFDISHLQGQFIVGACIRYVDGTPEKKSFRKFKIKTLTDQNDYAALQEIVQRRYKDHKNEPNLVIVDGGIGQINAIKPFIKSAELVGLAKREETIISSDLTMQIKLNPQLAEDALLLQIRDYTHHFAISYHRQKRTILPS